MTGSVPEPLLHQGVHLPQSRTFDLPLLRELQEEYRGALVAPAPQDVDPASSAPTAEERVAGLLRRVGKIDGARVLEIGCGRGDVVRALADQHGCRTVGVDVAESEAWTERPGLEFRRHDVSTMDNGFLGTFDLVVSFGVWGHLVHPFSALRAVRSMTETSGRTVISASLYRGPRASHRYPDIAFPWPHLLFEDDVVVDYYRQDLGRTTSGAAWVNKLTSAHYLTYFRRLGFETDQLSTPPSAFDEAFYARFEDVLGRYPLFDLKRDSIDVVLTPGQPVDPERDADELQDLRRQLRRLERQRDRAQQKVRALEDSRSWRLTGPLRRVGARASRLGR